MLNLIRNSYKSYVNTSSIMNQVNRSFFKNEEEFMVLFKEFVSRYIVKKHKEAIQLHNDIVDGKVERRKMVENSKSLNVINILQRMKKSSVKKEKVNKIFCKKCLQSFSMKSNLIRHNRLNTCEDYLSKIEKYKEDIIKKDYVKTQIMKAVLDGKILNFPENSFNAVIYEQLKRDIYYSLDIENINSNIMANEPIESKVFMYRNSIEESVFRGFDEMIEIEPDCWILTFYNLWHDNIFEDYIDMMLNLENNCNIYVESVRKDTIYLFLREVYIDGVKKYNVIFCPTNINDVYKHILEYIHSVLKELIKINILNNSHFNTADKKALSTRFYEKVNEQYMTTLRTPKLFDSFMRKIKNTYFNYNEIAYNNFMKYSSSKIVYHGRLTITMERDMNFVDVRDGLRRKMTHIDTENIEIIFNELSKCDMYKPRRKNVEDIQNGEEEDDDEDDNTSEDDEKTTNNSETNEDDEELLEV
jgi:hypothetical protein